MAHGKDTRHSSSFVHSSAIRNSRSTTFHFAPYCGSRLNKIEQQYTQIHCLNWRVLKLILQSTLPHAAYIRAPRHAWPNQLHNHCKGAQLTLCGTSTLASFQDGMKNWENQRSNQFQGTFHFYIPEEAWCWLFRDARVFLGFSVVSTTV